MRLIKLTKEDYQRSLKARICNGKWYINHLWVYSKHQTTQRTHNNSIFLTRTIGEPMACLVIEEDSIINDADIEKLFGKGAFIDGGVSPDDRENMNKDCYYIKRN